MALSEGALDRMEQLAGDAFRRVGSYRLAVDAAERDELRGEYDALREDGFAVDWVDELAAPLDRLYAGAIHHPPDGALQPARWVRRLAAHAAAAGADVREHDPVRVDALDADVVVVAGDGFTASLLPELAQQVRATRGQVLVTAPLAELRYPSPHYARSGYDYWQQLPDGRLVLGGNRDASLETEDTDVIATTAAIQQGLDELAERLVGGRPRGDEALGRDLGHDARPAAARRPGTRARRRLGRRWLLRAWQRTRPRVRRARRTRDPGRATAGARALRSGTVQAALTPAASLATESLASPNSITVFGFRKSGFSIPAKPGFIERFSTTIACDWSTFRIGIP